MIRSMTAFARQHRKTQDGVLCWELRSVNHRFLEISVHLPSELRSLEAAVRERIGALLKRGKIEAYLRFQALAGTAPADAERALHVNHALVKQLLGAVRQIAPLAEHAAPVNVLDLLRWPGVLETQEPDTEQTSMQALALLDDSLHELIAMRVREGEKIKALVEQRCSAMHAILGQVRHELPKIMASLRARLMNRFAELALELDPLRLEQEMLILIQKTDIDEEIERLEMHAKEICSLVHHHEPVGRRLDFLMQELNREANTLGAKSIGIETTRASLELKVIIEQMREQIQNIE